MMADFTDLNDVIVDGVVQASGKLKGGQQATEQGDAVLLGADNKIPSSMYDKSDLSEYYTKEQTDQAIDDAIADIDTDTSVEAGTGLEFSGNTLNHSNSTIARSNYGGAQYIPIISCDAQGHITSLSRTQVYPPTSAGQSYQYWRSDGSGTGQWTTPASSPVNNSNTLISSGAVYTALQNIEIDTSDFYTKSEVNAIAQAFTQWDVQFVESLPGTGTQGVMYMVPSSDGSYSEQYVWIGSSYVKVGNTSMTGRWVDQGAPSEVVFEEGAKYRIWFYDGCAQFCYIKIPNLTSIYSISPDNSTSSYPYVRIDTSNNKIESVHVTNGIISYYGEYIFIEKWVGE